MCPGGCTIICTQAQPGHIGDLRKALLNARTSVASYQCLDVADWETGWGATKMYIEVANYLRKREVFLMPRHQRYEFNSDVGGPTL